MARMLLLCAAAVIAASVGRAQTPAEYDVETWQARAAHMREVCAADRESAACLVAAQGVRADLARALLMLAERGDRAATLQTARRLLALSPPEIKTAAAYAIAQAGPEDQDTAALLPLLNDPAPTLRRAAYGALMKSADPATREWVQRARPQAVGERFVADRRSVDEASTGVAPPPGAAPVWFEMQVWDRGAQVFTADADAESVLAHFSAIAGAAPVALSEAETRFALDNDARAMFERYGNTAWFANPRVVVLDEGSTERNDARPARLAVVWDDPLFGKAGYALQWIPANAMPGYRDRPWSNPRDEIENVKLDQASFGEPGSLFADWRKPGADELENAFYLNILLGEGLGALDYLDLFPDGHYRAEVEAKLTEARVYVDDATLIEPTEIRIGFENMPSDRPIRFDVVRRLSAAEAASRGEAEPPQNPTEPVTGLASGEAVWKTDSPLPAGLYDIRVFYGPFEMDWDADSLRRYMPGDEPQFRREIRILPRLVGLTTDKQVYAPAEMVHVTFKDMPLPRSPGAAAPFVTLVAADAPEPAWQQYVYTEAETGTVKLEAPIKPGAYQARVHFQSDGIVHGIANITVGDLPRATPEPTPEPTPTPAPTPVPEDMNVVITLTKADFAPDEPITGKVTGLSGDRDWIAVVPAGAEDGTTGAWIRAPRGATEADFTLPGQPAGAYEIRVRFHDQYRPVRRRQAFEIK